MSRPGLALLVRHARPARGRTARIVVLSAVEAAPVLASGWVVARALDDGFLAGRPGTGFALLGVLALAHVVQVVAGRALTGLFADIVEPMRDGLVTDVVGAALATAAAGRTDHGATPDAATVDRLTAQVEQARSLVGGLLGAARSVTLTTAAALVGLATLSPVLVAVVAAPLVVVLLAYPVTVRALGRRSRTVVLADEAVAVAVGRATGAVRDLTALGAQDRATADVTAAARAHARASTARARVAATRVALITVGGRLPLVLVLVVGAAQLADGRISPGDLVGAVLYLTSQLLPALAVLTGPVSDYWTQLDSVLTRLAETGRGRLRDAPRTGARPPEYPDLVADRIHFSFGAAAAPVVSDLSLHLRPGDHLAIVGASGIGKSTVGALLAGLETPAAGCVRLGGIALADLDPAARHDGIALIPQQAYVFEGTLAENLRYQSPTAGGSQLDAACAATGLDAVVARLGGYDAALVDPAAQLSAGERQLVALTRVLLSAASVVILDEATCHLDPRAEARAEAAFAQRPGVLVVVAHRLSSAIRAGSVLFLHDGGAALGRHVDLLATHPCYARLFALTERGPGLRRAFRQL